MKTSPNINKLSQQDFADPEKLTDRLLLAKLCTAIPQCMTCDVYECAYGREFRKRVREGTLGRHKNHENKSNN